MILVSYLQGFLLVALYA